MNNLMDEQHVLALPAGYQLGKYSFRGVLGSGGFGITYLADDTSLQRKVAIKELLPNDFATRVDGTTVVAKTQGDNTSLEWALGRFMDEGRALAACDHPNVVNVYEMIEANGTAYMVTKFEEGCNLERWFRNLDRCPTEKELRTILLPLLSGLEKVHRAGFLHRDIKPENIYMTLDRPVLLDFGSARQAIRGRSMVMTSIITPGYAPFEQYHEDGNQGPWTDIYALGAVMYRGITGEKPPEAIRRIAADTCNPVGSKYAGQYSRRFLKSIDCALRLKESERPQSVVAWRELLGSDASSELAESKSISRRSATSKPLNSGLDRSGSSPIDKTSKEVTPNPGVTPIVDFVKRYPKRTIGSAIAVVAVLIGLCCFALLRPNPPSPLVLPEPSPQPVITPKPTPNPSPVTTPMPTPSPSPVTTPTPVPSPSPVTTPTPAPNPSPVVNPLPVVNPSATPVATPSPSGEQMDSKLVGTWKAKFEDGKTETWQLRKDGSYLLGGSKGVLTTSDGVIHQLNPLSNQTIDLKYRFDAGKLVTTDPTGVETSWQRVTSESGGAEEGRRHERDHVVRPARNNGPGIGQAIANAWNNLSPFGDHKKKKH